MFGGSNDDNTNDPEEDTDPFNKNVFIDANGSDLIGYWSFYDITLGIKTAVPSMIFHWYSRLRLLNLHHKSVLTETKYLVLTMIPILMFSTHPYMKKAYALDITFRRVTELETIGYPHRVFENHLGQTVSISSGLKRQNLFCSSPKPNIFVEIIKL